MGDVLLSRAAPDAQSAKTLGDCQVYGLPTTMRRSASACLCHRRVPAVGFAGVLQVVRRRITARPRSAGSPEPRRVGGVSVPLPVVSVQNLWLGSCVVAHRVGSLVWSTRRPLVGCCFYGIYPYKAHPICFLTERLCKYKKDNAHSWK